MKKGTSRLLVFMLFACGLIALSGQQSYAAQGDVEWSEVLPAGYMSPSAGARVTTHGDDSVTVGACGSTSDNYRVDTYDSSGDLTNTDSGTKYPSVCDSLGLAGADGTVFYTTFESGRAYLVVRRGGVQIAKHDFDFQCYSGTRYGRAGAMKLGRDGNAYAVMTNFNSCGKSDRLVGINARTGDIMYSHDLSSRTQPTGDVAKMGMYDDGVVVLEENINSSGHDILSYFAYDGTRNNNLSCSVQASTDSCGFGVSMGDTVQTFFVDENGTSYIDTTMYVGGACPTSQHTLRYTAGGSASSLSRPSNCAAWLTGILPGGELVFAVPNSGIIKVLDLSGTELISGNSAIKSGYSVTARGPVLVDGTGHVVVQRTAQKDSTSDKFVFVDQLQSNGTWLTLFETEQFATAGTDNFSFRGTLDIPSVAFGDDALYVTICSTACNDGLESVTLYKVDSPGMGFEYPRSEIIQAYHSRLNYVALGDSFSSGEGVEPFEPNTAIPSTNECHRSEKAYSKVLSDTPGSRLNLTKFVACSGATTSNIINSIQWDEGSPQYSALSGADVVTISVGGNDVSFAPTIERCVIEASGLGPAGDCDDALDASEAQVDALDVLLSNALDKIKDEIGSQTEVYVVGYPHILPQQGTTFIPACSGRVFSGDGLSRIWNLTDSLNDVIFDEVIDAGSQFHYVDTTVEFNGHELCTVSPYFNDAIPFTNQSYWYHPNEEGQKAYARAVTIAIS